MVVTWTVYFELFVSVARHFSKKGLEFLGNYRVFLLRRKGEGIRPDMELLYGFTFW